MKKRMFKDGLLNGLTYLFSSFGVLILVLIFVFIFLKGSSSVSFDLLKGDYYSESYTLKYTDEHNDIFYYECNDGEFFSKVWGVAFVDTTNLEGEEVVSISYVDSNSPLNNMIDVGSNHYISIEVGQFINKGRPCVFQ